MAVLVGSCVERLRELEDESVHCVVTSPPYWGLRDYGTAMWDGGDADCEHVDREIRTGLGLAEWSAEHAAGGGHKAGDVDKIQFRDVCGKCGARRVDEQIGLEATPGEYVARLVEVFREVRRVLRADGTLWLNIGDCYASGGRGGGPDGCKQQTNKGSLLGPKVAPPGVKDKDLLMIPAQLAQALQESYYTGTIKDERDRIWLAAMIDAEGCMFIHKRKVGQSNGQGYVRKTDSYGAGLEVSSTDRVIVERIHAITGRGSICEQGPKQNDRRKQVLYRWNLRTNECRDVIREVYPHLVAKQHEARLVIGCPSSGPDAARAHESLKAIHQGGTPDTDFAAPESMFERGWYLRSEIIWSKKPNPMPESVTDRPTSAHEKLFLFTKSGDAVYWTHRDGRGVRQRPPADWVWVHRETGETSSDARDGKEWRRVNLWAGHDYFYDHVAIRESSPENEQRRGAGSSPVRTPTTRDLEKLSNGHNRTGYAAQRGVVAHGAGRNRRNVWEIATVPYAEAHFATFPTKLVEPCVLAGGSRRACSECGAPWERMTERFVVRGSRRSRPETPLVSAEQQGRNGVDSSTFGEYQEVRTVGWQPTCDHGDGEGRCVVLDPFAGSGTVGVVCEWYGREFVGIELNPGYAAMARDRIATEGVLRRRAYRPEPPAAAQLGLDLG